MQACSPSTCIGLNTTLHSYCKLQMVRYRGTTWVKSIQDFTWPKRTKSELFGLASFWLGSGLVLDFETQMQIDYGSGWGFAYLNSPWVLDLFLNFTSIVEYILYRKLLSADLILVHTQQRGPPDHLIFFIFFLTHIQMDCKVESILHEFQE